MSATSTAVRVVEWALAPSGRPPSGDLREAHELSRPAPQLALQLGQLAAVTAARMRLGAPPLRDASPLSAASAVLAAALGSLDQPAWASAIVASLPTPRGAAEQVVRHGLAAPALPFLSAEVAGSILQASPLTALLEQPAGGGDAAALGMADKLLADAAGRLALLLRLAQPTASPGVRRFRASLLDRLRLAKGSTSYDFVLDVYEAAMIHHQQEHLDQVRAARAVLIDPVASSVEERLADALAVAEWWRPLAAIERTNIDALRERLYLGYPYRRGLDLYRLAQRLRGGAP